VRRFEQEVRAASSLNHPNITIFEIGQEGATHYIATEFTDGETLRQQMERGRVGLRLALNIATQIAAALSPSHEAGIIHRVIKPENVMVRRDGIVKVLDFGLAKLTQPSLPSVDTQAPTLVRHSTEAGVMMGTPRYLSPEQRIGDLKNSDTLAEESDSKPKASFFSIRNRYLRWAAIRNLALLAVLLIATPPASFCLNRPPVLTSRDTILLADFEHKTGDDIFDEMLKQGLAIQLQQSPFPNLFPGERVRPTLRLMNRPPDVRVTAGIAREICERQGIKALIAGSIAPLGSHYVITLEAINAQNGEALASEQAEAEKREHVLRALSQAATRLREKLGESLSSIEDFFAVWKDADPDSPIMIKAKREYEKAR
jgi:serine/threonine protein kinase